ncbi:unnamed protein product [Ectocarpus sp. 8 AP-2014]
MCSSLNTVHHHAVMCFNARGDWRPAVEPLHRDIDLRKQHRCGVGPSLVRI